MDKNSLEGYELIKKYRDEGKNFFDEAELSGCIKVSYGVADVILLGIIGFLGYEISTNNIKNINALMATLMGVCIALGWFSIAYINVDTARMILKDKKEDEFKEKYPNVDINISDDQLEEVLKYSEENKYNDVVKKTMGSYKDEFDKMSLDEKIDYLDNNIELFDIALYKEQYGLDDLKELNNYREGKRFCSKKKIASYLLKHYGTLIGVSTGIGALASLMGDTTKEKILSGCLFGGTSLTTFLRGDSSNVKDKKVEINTNAFKNLYPNVDMNITDTQLEKALEYIDNEDKYNEDMNDALGSNKGVYDKMSTSEKIEFLKAQKSFFKTAIYVEKANEKTQEKTKTLKK